MSTPSSSVHSELSASTSLVDASGASTQYEGEGFDKESGSLIASGDHEEQEEQKGDANGTTYEYEDDAFEDNLESADGIHTVQVLVMLDADSASSHKDDDSYSGDHFEEDEAATYSQVDVETPQLQQDGDEQAFASYGEESFEFEPDDVSALLLLGDETQTGEQELEWMTKQDRDVEAQSMVDSSKLSLPDNNRWCADKIKTLTAHKAESASGFLAATPAHMLPIEACQALRRQLQHKSKQTSGSGVRDASNAREPMTCRSRSLTRTVERCAHLPSEFLEKMLSNAKTKRLLYTTFDALVVSEPEAEREQTAASALETNQKCLSTFCKVKRADLEGKLTTLRFKDQWSRSCTNQQPSEMNEMSIGTLEFLQEIVAKQREALRFGISDKSEAGSGGETLFSCMKTCAPSLNLTVESTQRCLKESRLLRHQAHRLIHPRIQAHRTTAG